MVGVDEKGLFMCVLYVGVLFFGLYVLVIMLCFVLRVMFGENLFLFFCRIKDIYIFLFYYGIRIYFSFLCF